MAAQIGQYVLKVHSRCDLACDHCYVYEHADQSWLAKPARIGGAVLARVVGRIAEHTRAHRLSDVLIVLHGGEPLLLGHAGLREVIGALRTGLDPLTRLDLRIHTNGVRLDERFCAVFTEYGVKVGVSLDGDRAANDRHRTYRNGRSSHAEVRSALALLRQHPHLYAGILCTIDLANDPLAVYEALLAEEPPLLDLLLPHATWDTPPYRPPGLPAPYAAWLGRIYGRWTADGRPMPIRLFDSILSGARGGPSWTEAIGLDPVDLLVIETDGTWEQADSLKTAFDGAPATGMSVFSHSVDEVAAHPGIAARRSGRDGLSAVCRSCEVVDICGGGLYAHRYRTGSGFDNPSAYCDDLKGLIRQVVPPRPHRPPRPGRSAVAHRLPSAALASLGAGPGDGTDLAELAESWLSITRALATQVATGHRGGDRELARITAAGWALLCELDSAHPQAVRKVMAHPYVRAWAVACLRPAAESQVDLDRAHLAGLAVAAAMHAGVPAELPLPVRDGRLHLPTLGAFKVGNADRTVRVRSTPDGLAAGPGGEWQPARRITSGVLNVQVEDLDPFRNRQGWPAADRLSPPAWRSWRSALDAAAKLLHRQLPSYANVLGAGLRSIVPLTGAPRGVTARHAHGAVAIALPPDADALSELLVRVFQSVKLNGLADMYDLHEPGVPLPVPWAPEPKSAEAVLRDTYTSLAIAELWRSRQARERFSHYRTLVAEGLEALGRSGALTADGERFVSGITATSDGWTEPP